jgi:glycerate 2-kinase
MRIVIAPNAFKNALDATVAAKAIERGLQKSKLDCDCVLFPIGDGGDGTGELLAAHFGASIMPSDVRNPMGESIESKFALTKGNVAIIELADASGLRLLDKSLLDPMRSTTFGTGQLIKHALDHGAEKIILCVGGSATVDGGCGILRALGFRFLNATGKEIKELPLRLLEIDAIDASEADKRIFNCEIKILSDVQTVVVGDRSAAKIFGPQKGATANQVALLDEGLKKLCEVILQFNGKAIGALPGGGAAGGVAGVLNALLGAEIVNGIEYFLNVTAFADVLIGAELVITGEGKIDDQTLEGKGPFGVARKAKDMGIRVCGMAGRIEVKNSEDMVPYFDELISIQNANANLEEALISTAQNLEHAALTLGNRYAMMNL